jgi:pyruvate dehydrogenase E2 component (dihydrolipoamide acetyltransferase)
MATKILMPKLSDTMTEGLILKWLKKEGDKVKQGETLVEIESDKADMELEAFDSGLLRKIIVPEGGKAGIGAPIGIIAGANEDITELLSDTPVNPQKTTALETAKGETQASLQTSQVSTPVNNADGRIIASPLAKRLAKENKIELRSVTGSGPQGRIIKRDIEPLAVGKNRYPQK